MRQFGDNILVSDGSLSGLRKPTTKRKPANSNNQKTKTTGIRLGGRLESQAKAISKA